jgi:hypothetical protein
MKTYEEERNEAIGAFNLKINELIADSPENLVLKEIIEKRKQWKMTDWYSILDRISFDYGFHFGIHQKDNLKGKILGYKPYVGFNKSKIKEQDALDCFGDITYFIKMDDCFSHMAKELIYLMMRIKQSNQLLQ